MILPSLKPFCSRNRVSTIVANERPEWSSYGFAETWTPPPEHLPETIWNTYERAASVGITVERPLRRALDSGFHVLVQRAMGQRKCAVCLLRSLYSRKAPRERLIQSYLGMVDRIDGDIAYVTLIDRSGAEILAECNAQELALDGIREGSQFTCLIKKRDSKTIVAIKSVPPRELTAKERRKICRETESALGDYDFSDEQ